MRAKQTESSHLKRSFGYETSLFKKNKSTFDLQAIKDSTQSTQEDRSITYAKK